MATFDWPRGLRDGVRSDSRDALEAIAAELVATEDFERDHPDLEDALDMLNELVGLAQLAESQGQVLFAWMHFA